MRSGISRRVSPSGPMVPAVGGFSFQGCEEGGEDIGLSYGSTLRDTDQVLPGRRGHRRNAPDVYLTPRSSWNMSPPPSSMALTARPMGVQWDMVPARPPCVTTRRSGSTRGSPGLPSPHFLVVPVLYDHLDCMTLGTRFPPTAIPVPSGSRLTCRYPYLALLAVRMSATDPSSAPRPDPPVRLPAMPEPMESRKRHPERPAGLPYRRRAGFSPMPGGVSESQARSDRRKARDSSGGSFPFPGSSTHFPGLRNLVVLVDSRRAVVPVNALAPIRSHIRRPGAECLVPNPCQSSLMLLSRSTGTREAGHLGPPVIPFSCWCHPGQPSP